MTRVLFLGQKPVGEEAFRLLLARQNEVLRACAACTNNTADVWWASHAVWDRCRELGLCCVPNDARREDELLALIKKHQINMILSVQHNWILSEKVLAAVGYNALNLHLAPLPAYRGYYSYNHAILNGDNRFGVTLHWMTREADGGPIAFAPGFELTARDTAWSVYQKALAAGLEAFEALVECFAAERDVPRQAMPSGGRFYGRDSLNAHRQISDIEDAAEVDVKARALYFPPYKGAWFSCGDKRYWLEPDDTGV